MKLHTFRNILLKKKEGSIYVLFTLLSLLLMGAAEMRGQGLGGGPQATHFDCGVFQKLGGTAPGYTGEVYYDRFGNAYTDDDMAANVTDECTAGVFKLSFSGDYTTSERVIFC